MPKDPQPASTMTTPHRTLQMALDALDAITDDVDGTGLNTMPSFDKAIDAIAALREALAQPAPERWMPIETAPKDVTILLYGAKRLEMCVGMHHSRDGWVTDTTSEWMSMYPPTHWMPLPAAPDHLRDTTEKAAPVAPVVREPVIDEMDAVASKYAHKMALDLECVLSDYSGKWWDAAMQTLGEYRSAMNAIHERESPTHMGEPVLRKEA